MKCKNIYLMPCLFSIAVLLGVGCSKVENTIPEAQIVDQGFESFCLDNFDTNHDGFISSEEARAVIYIHIQEERTIKSFEGIEMFTELDSLRCDNISGLERIDLSKNKKLSVISISSFSKDNNAKNVLKTFNLGEKPNLKKIKLPNFTLSNAPIDIKNYPNLVYLEMGIFAPLALENLPALQYLICNNKNKTLNYLNLSLFPNLQYVDLRGSTSIKDVDLTGLKNLTSFFCGVHPNDTIGVSSLRILNTSTPALEIIQIEGVKNVQKIDLSENSNLETFICIYNLEKDNDAPRSLEVEFPQTSQLKRADIYNMPIKKIDLSKQSQLQSLQIERVVRPMIIWPENNVITSLSYTGALLKEINLDSFTQLQNLDLSQNWFETLDVTEVPSLISLTGAENRLKSLTISKNSNLKQLLISNNRPLTSLDLSENSDLQEIDINETKIDTLDISTCAMINSISAQDTPLRRVWVDNAFKWTNQFIFPDFTELFRKESGEMVGRE